MSRRSEVTKLDAFGQGGGDLEEVADEIYGASNGDGLDTGRVVARPTPLDEIWADLRQPRRAIPSSVRNGWDGNPKDVSGLLQSWSRLAVSMTDGTIDFMALLDGTGEGADIDGLHPLVEAYVQLLRLAQDIRRVGLSNPISVIRMAKGGWMIESGERRYLAYHLLNMYDGGAGKWSKIPAIVSDGKDFVWRQASENTARRQLNAIGMARQLALLIMASRDGTEDIKYSSYGEIVIPGGCDRRYYAQVANGSIHRIPKGMGERIQAAMGLSMAQLSHYRNLLRLYEDDENLNDLLWTRADIEDWPEFALREIARTFTPVKVWQIVRREEWTLDDLRALAVAASPQVNPSPSPSPYTERGTGSTTSSGATYGGGNQPHPPAPSPSREGEKSPTPSPSTVGWQRGMPVRVTSDVANLWQPHRTSGWFIQGAGRLLKDAIVTYEGEYVNSEMPGVVIAKVTLSDGKSAYVRIGNLEAVEAATTSTPERPAGEAQPEEAANAPWAYGQMVEQRDINGTNIWRRDGHHGGMVQSQEKIPNHERLTFLGIHKLPGHSTVWAKVWRGHTSGEIVYVLIYTLEATDARADDPVMPEVGDTLPIGKVQQEETPESDIDGDEDPFEKFIMAGEGSGAEAATDEAEEDSDNLDYALLEPESPLANLLEMMAQIADEKQQEDDAEMLRDLAGMTPRVIRGHRSDGSLPQMLNNAYEAAMQLVTGWVENDLADYLAWLEKEA